MRAAAYYVLCWSTIALLAKDVIPGGIWLVLAVGAATTAPLIAFLRGRGWRRYPSAAFRLFVVRPVLYAQLLLPLVAGGGIIGLLVGALAGAPLVGGRISALTVLAVMIVLLVTGYVGSRRLVVRDITVSLPDLPAALAGLRIAQLSDLHVGPQTSRRYLSRVARTAMDLTPDLVAITGDLVDDRAEDVPYFAVLTDALTAPLGVYLIPGNHDIYAGWAEVARSLRARVAATVLVNEAHVLTHDGARIAIVGTGDPAGRRTGDAAPDIERALAAVPEGTVVIALAHNPVLWGALATKGVALTLSGHTHWGQFAIPALGWSLASPFQSLAMGAHQSGGSLLYIHPGTGYWGLPFRIGATPEVALITLRRGPAVITMSPRPTAAAARAPRPQSALHPRPAPV